MRLLDTKTIKLHEFFDSDVPRYAILSHNWEKEEVSFQALPKPESKDLAGYQKITRCYALAASERYQYAWIDTCCIDKTSSAELSEAINPMFRWYQNAEICYTYLADVVDREGRFCNSRCFSRGWTLQELYDCDWQKIGPLRQLTKETSAATGIDAKYLDDPWWKEASVAESMSWASNRKTSRLEDIAYCLMGIFDVNMPLLYGERQKAFMRLQHEIVKTVDDESIFAWEDGTRLESGMFASSPAAFADGGDIISIEFPGLHRPDTYEVTNRGLSIEIFIDIRRLVSMLTIWGHWN